ncbi:MAG TPA: bifunctional riboflavin kinase/FAD synthetase [bacterium]|nr:bifunctional riboflavin kinase/FAD synthetase [bacterium]
MKIIRDLGSIKVPLERSVVTIGMFDGVHVGHQKVIRDVIARAKKTGGKSVVVTFRSHPQKVTGRGGETPLITSPEHKVSLIENLGVDVCLLFDFNREFSLLSPQIFVRKVLVDKLGAAFVFVGFNFLFGHNRTGGVELLRTLGRESGYRVVTEKPVTRSGITVSSTVIRKLIGTGDLALASALLGREYSLYGTVVKGDRIGRHLGYPTANIDPHNEVIPPTGVYAVKAVCGGEFYDAVVNIGVRPTFRLSDDVRMSVEAHLLDFSHDIYGEHLEMFFIRKLREERRFPHKDDLVRQIRKDEAAARNILAKTRRVKYRAHKGKILY